MSVKAHSPMAGTEGLMDDRELGSVRALATEEAPDVLHARDTVAQYLRDVGLTDPDLIAEESRVIVDEAQRTEAASCAEAETSLSAVAVRLCVERLDQWLLALSARSGVAEQAGPLGSVVGARLPNLLGRYPHALKQGPLPEFVDGAQQEFTPVVPQPQPRSMRRQRLALIPAWLKLLPATLLGRDAAALHPAPAATTPAAVRPAPTLPRLALAIATLTSTGLATWLYCQVIAEDGFGWFDGVLAGLFGILFMWVSFSFWAATFGFLVVLRRPNVGDEPLSPTSPGELVPTAIVMPIYNEDPLKVFANLHAVAQSLEKTGCAAAFSVFVLSDTTDPDVWLEEERAWARLAVELPTELRVFYRHRTQNSGRKAGNIADFCRRWGGLYQYMIVLDADSVMEGSTMVEMVRRMQADPEIGILQAPPRPVQRHSFFARTVQFAAYVYGPVFLEGFALWSQCDGNYWGHNAIIRIRPFMEHCDLPILPGDGPLGGEILSHDFVEAALMRRAGYKVCLAHDLDGSYEECPTNLLDYAQRDQRWCQGNMQHLRLVCAEGLHPTSRLHFGMGAMAYLASSLWLLFLLLTFLGALVIGGAGTAESIPGGALLFSVSMAMLLLPKLWGVIALGRRAHRGAREVWKRAWASMVVETFSSMLVAPIMMLLHTQFVAATFLGKKVTWNAQNRDDGGLTLGDAISVHYGHTLCGVGGAVLAWLWAPGLLPWLSPVLLGLALAIPLCMLLGSVRFGEFLARRRLLLVPEEVAPTGVLQLQQTALARAQAARSGLLDQTEPFILVLRDPTFYLLHVGMLRATDAGRPISAEQRTRIGDLVRAAAMQQISAQDRRAVLSDSATLQCLHLLMRSHHRQRPSAFAICE